ncbi:MAG: EFR1 family ferrodoxin [Bacteroidales bacterium]|jgi:ferredoxin|nr:EFR1 family ferrodoxin [Bacteroidales bacterium]
MTILYFTSTGNCLQLAKKIGGIQLSIPQMIKENKYHFEDDAIGLIFPVYGFGLPKIVKRFLEKASFKAQYTFAVGTYGNTPGAVMFNLHKFAVKRGITFDYMNELLTVDNYLPVFDVNDQIARLPEKKTAENIEKIVSDIHNRKTNLPKASVSLKVLTAFIQSMSGVFSSGKAAQKFIVNEKCKHCGICTNVCPVSNINIADKVVFSDRCESCFGCVHHCPANAIHLRNEKSTARYRNAEVTLKEIQNANCQNGLAKRI